MKEEFHPSKLLKHAKIKNSMLFVGQGKTFQIWEQQLLKNLRLMQKKIKFESCSLKWEHQLNKSWGIR